MNKKNFKLTYLKIKISLAQFISLVFISAIGIAMFIGILSVGPTMQYNANKYLNNQKNSDLNIISSTGFSKTKLNELENKFNIKYNLNSTIDVSVFKDGEEIISRLLSFDEINKPYLKEGRLPTNSSECLSISRSNDLLNKEIKVEAFKQERSCKVVGIAKSSQYLSQKYFGYSTKSVGQVSTIILVKNKFVSEMFSKFNYFEYQNTLDILFLDKPSNNFFSNEYQDFISNSTKDIEKLFNNDNMIFTKSIDNISIDNYYKDSSRISQIAAIFPIIFFLVAALVGASTMSRMIEDDRLEIGTILSLGYSKIYVSRIYLQYVLIAIIFGSILGVLAGVYILPPAVNNAYSNLYDIPFNEIVFQWDIISIALVITFLLIVGSTLFVIVMQVKNSCATLLRLKSPIAGKKTFIENIGFIWKRLTFINKVSARNLLRYKKRLIMSVLAIVGCSALLITGLGIRTSVTPIINLQFNKINKFDISVNTKAIPYHDVEKKTNYFKNNYDIETLTATIQKNASVKNNNTSYDFTLISPFNKENFNKLIVLDYKLDDNKTIISNKLAQNLNLKEQDTLSFTINNEKYKLKVDEITTQYIGNFLYVGKDVFKENIGKLNYNNFLIKSATSSDSTIKKLTDNSSVLNIIDTNTTVDNISNSFNGINSIVFIMIGFAGILVITVMYILSTINLIERHREIATLKVLGFYDSEVNKYLLKENIIITIIGLIIGLSAGSILHIYIISQVELVDIYFIKTQPFYNYIIAFIITFIFSLSVNLIMQRKIKDIDMVSSLKSIE